ncbi:DUF7700 domain-containing protein [Pseudomonas typographi]|uniref:DUF7700 domain-containing protein n=1 Tax=Pseudomonas typographi TaxID=2715964 RepID=A0ABR7Z2Y7_9PSED|nr:hypothetical protein [Pseudomonas typographi]MBD1553132.1 hypothetical protein [Pseudomonas typographi]MBD1585881.1 hypothetical protein [Pseudomonas typographi]MBD1599753.1 hypothetical protein [Pseudomonas typographi]
MTQYTEYFGGTEYRFTLTHAGKLYPGDPFPHVEEHTTYYPAGVIAFGVEGRVLPEGELGGPTLHIFDTATGQEYLRFDAFPGFEHYHYLMPGVSNHVVGFDGAANGDFVTWLLDRVKHALPQLLGQTGGAGLVPQLDAKLVKDALAPIEAALRHSELSLANLRTARNI